MSEEVTPQAAPAAAPEALKLLAEREQRINDAIALRKPDRVPVWHGVPGPYPSERLGITRAEQMMDIEKSLEANFQTALYYQSDMVELMPPLGATLGPLGYRHLRWAGHGLPADSGWQFVDEEVMKPEEYDEFIYDPSDFMVRRYWPRAYGKLAGLAGLAPLREGQGYFAGPFAFAALGTPAGREALDALREAGAAALKTVMALAGHGRRLAEAGFPSSWAAMAQPPFDFVGDFLRGRKGVMRDMFRCPEKLEAAAEKMLPMAIEMAVRGARMSRSSIPHEATATGCDGRAGGKDAGSVRSGAPGATEDTASRRPAQNERPRLHTESSSINQRVFIAVHGGVEGFMSLDQYKRFYWPTLQQLLVALAEEGLNPFVLVEGGSNSRLETMADIPAGKICYWFDHVDMHRAKTVLSGKACIAGNVPIALLTVGTPDDVRAYCKDLIDTVGRDGGFIMGPSGQTEDVKIENVKAMVDFTKEYGG